MLEVDDGWTTPFGPDFFRQISDDGPGSMMLHQTIEVILQLDTGNPEHSRVDWICKKNGTAPEQVTFVAILNICNLQQSGHNTQRSAIWNLSEGC